MSATYAAGGQVPTKAGGVIIATVSFLCAVLVLGGIYYAAGTGQRHKVALAAGACEPNLSPSGLPCTTVQMLVGQYKQMTVSDIQQLSTAVAAYTANQGSNIVAAEAALKAQVTLENGFGTSLAQFPFPPAVAPVAQKLMQATSALAKLTAEQARSTSLTQLQSFNSQVVAASAAVQTDVTLVGKALNKAPTANQEP